MLSTENRVFLRQTKSFTAANLKTRYRGTWSGVLWVALQPILQFTVSAFVFHFIMKIQMERYFLFLLSGTLPWMFLSQSLEMTVGTFTHHGRLLKSFPVQPMVLIVAQIFDNLLNFSIAFGILLLPCMIFYDQNLLKIFLLPLPILTLVISVYSLSTIMAVTQVFFSDARFIMTFILQIGFFLTPIFYPARFVPERFQWYLKLNPFAYIIAPFQAIFAEVDIATFWPAFLDSVLIAGLFSLMAFAIWRWRRNELYFRF